VDGKEEDTYPLRDSGYQGPEGNLPKASVNVTFGNSTIAACHSGPDEGVAEVQTGDQPSRGAPAPGPPAAALAAASSSRPAPAARAADWKLDWANNSAPYSCGRCESLYETDPKTGQRSGDPVADCFGTVAYADGCAMALSDGVSWGAKPRLAACRAVYASLRGMHGIRAQLAGQTVGSGDVLQRMLEVGVGAWLLGGGGGWRPCVGRGWCRDCRRGEGAAQVGGGCMAQAELGSPAR
jgi:hypothetical protein